MKRLFTIAVFLTVSFAGVLCAQPGIEFVPYGTPLYGGEVYDICRTSNGVVFAVAGTGVYRTTDEGDTWERLNAEYNSMRSNVMRLCAAHSVDGDGVILYSGDEDYRATLITTDYGQTWIPVPVLDAFTNSKVTLLPGAEGRIVASVYPVTPADSTYILVQGGNGFDTVDVLSGTVDDPAVDAQGTLWMLHAGVVKYRAWKAATSEDILSPDGFMEKLIVAGTRVFVFTDGGVYLLNEDRSTWTLTQGLDIAGMSSLSATQFIPADDGSLLGVVYAGTVLSTVQHLPAGSTSWSTTPVRLEDISSVESGVQLSSGRYLVTTSRGYGPYRSSADLSTWEVRNQGLTSMPLLKALMVNNMHTVASTFEGEIYHREGTSSAWHRATEPSMRVTGDFPIDGFAVTGNGTVLATTRNGMYRSTTSGAAWQVPPPPDGMEAWPRTRGNACVVNGSIVYVAANTRLLKSDDHGATWTVAATEENGISSVTVTPEGTVYVGIEGGIGVYANGSISLAFPMSTSPEALVSSTDPGFVAGIGATSRKELVFSRVIHGQANPDVTFEFPNPADDDMLAIGSAALPNSTVLVTTLDGMVVLPLAGSAFLVSSRFEDLVLDVRVQAGVGVVATNLKGYVLTSALPSGVNDGAITGVAGAVYPNPVHDVAYVSVPPSATSVVVMDMMGRAVLDLTGNTRDGACRIDAGSLGLGSYTIVYTDGRNTVGVPFVVVR